MKDICLKCGLSDMDCTCEKPEWYEVHECEFCGGLDEHDTMCPENESSYAKLMQRGYD